MADGDYSQRTLVEKLGIRQEDNMTLLNAPANYDELIDEWPLGVSVSRDVLDEQFSFIHGFFTERAQLEEVAPELVRHLVPDGRLWLSWPKQASGMATDIDENILREVLLPLGVVDNKVAAIDETWSGLQFVWRRENRL